MAGAGGVLGLLAGGAAVFVTDNEAGSVALLTVGILFSFFGLAGLLPTRLKLGDNEIEWQQVADALADAVDEAPPESRAALIRSIADLSEAAPTLAGRSLSGLAREAALIDLLRAAMPTSLQWQREVVLAAGDRRFILDALVLDPTNGRRLGIELKANSRPVDGTLARMLVSRLGPLLEEGEVDRLLLVTGMPMTDRAQQEVQRAGIRTLVVTGAEDIPQLRQAILDALQSQQGQP